MTVCKKHNSYRLQIIRTFLDARIKWVRDPYLDEAVQREKNLKQIISIKNQIISAPTKTIPVSKLYPLKTHFDLPIPAAKFVEKYPSFFTQFQPGYGLPLHVKLTTRALSLHREELCVHNSQDHREATVERLAKLLMLTRAGKLPLSVIERFKWDLGLSHDYVRTLLVDYPEYFQVCGVEDSLLGREVLGLELVSWRKNLGVSELEDRALMDDLSGNRGKRIAFPMIMPRGFDFPKKVQNWVDEWQNMLYISPYEDAFHLAWSGDQAEKWTVAVLHELLWLLVSKKTETDNLFCLGEYLGFGRRFKKALVHHPGIFYLSNKIRTQTAVLREAYRKDFLIEKHPLMGMRHRYIHLMNKSRKQGKKVVAPFSSRKQVTSSAKGEEEEKSSVTNRGEGEEDSIISSDYES